MAVQTGMVFRELALSMSSESAIVIADESTLGDMVSAREFPVTMRKQSGVVGGR